MKKSVILNGRPFINSEFIETNSAIIFLMGERAFKILKIGREGVDCSTVSKRRVLLTEEMAINLEISPSLYFGVKPIVPFHGELLIGDDSLENSDAAEYALCMKRLSLSSLVYNMLSNGTYSDENSACVARYIANFHTAKLLNPTDDDRDLTKRFGTVESLEAVVEKDFQKFEGLSAYFIPAIATDREYQEIKMRISEFLRRKRDILVDRIKSGWVLPVHGDFHSRNIFVENGIVYAIDRSLRKNMRVADIIKDLAYFTTDLEVFGFEKQKERFLREYRSILTENSFLDQLLLFYMCRRAFVAIMNNIFEESVSRLRAYFSITCKYASLIA